MTEHIHLLAGASSDGKPVLEDVLVEQLPDGYRLLVSPGLVLGVAAGDLLAVESGGRFRVLRRGGNVCVQVFASPATDRLEQALQDRFAPLGGRIDGRTDRLIVVTVPVQAGFPGIEAALSAVMRDHPTAEWYFGNVYDPRDGVTPLNWW